MWPTERLYIRRENASLTFCNMIIYLLLFIFLKRRSILIITNCMGLWTVKCHTCVCFVNVYFVYPATKVCSLKCAIGMTWVCVYASVLFFRRVNKACLSPVSVVLAVYAHKRGGPLNVYTLFIFIL